METQREFVPRTDTGELETALAFLAFARHCVLKKTDGLDEEQLRRVLVPSGTSLLGLVQHLADSERYWFGHHLVGTAFDGDFEMVVPEDRSVVEVLDDYRRAIAESDSAIRSVGDPEALAVTPVDDRRLSLRWVLAHMTSETASREHRSSLARSDYVMTR